MQNSQHKTEQSVVECPTFVEAPTSDEQKPVIDYGRYGTFEGMCEALDELFEELTYRERIFFIFALECCVNGRTH